MINKGLSKYTVVLEVRRLFVGAGQFAYSELGQPKAGRIVEPGPVAWSLD